MLLTVVQGKFVATVHRVRAPRASTAIDKFGFGRFSIPFFFEPGEECIVRSIESGEGVRYGDHVRSKMGKYFPGPEG